MKKIFILTGEPSGDKLASTVISRLKLENSEIKYLSVGGEHLKNLGINSIFDLKEITYLGFTSVLLNIFKIKAKINKTVDEIIKFNPDILFSVDSPDFTLRVAEKVKKINTNIKTIHYVAPQVWVWRKNRVKKIKNFIDHMLLLFDFEKKYFDNEKIINTFVGHPLIEKNENNNKIVENIIPKDKKIISIFPGSRKSETDILLTILISSHYKLTYIRNVLLKESYLPSGNYLALSTLDNKCKIIDCKGFYAFVPGSDFWRPDSRQDKYAQLLFSASYKFHDLEFINFSETIISSDLKFYSPKGNHLSKSGNKKIYIKLINSLDKIN